MYYFKNELKWESFLGNSKHEFYARAIYLGQGCWDELYIIDEWEAMNMLREWGYEKK